VVLLNQQVVSFGNIKNRFNIYFMKHLNKYNESVDNDEISDYIKLVFADFIDDGSDFEYSGGKECYVNFDLNTLHKLNKKLTGFSIGTAHGKVSDFIKNTEKNLEIYKEIETCINRIQDKYSDIRYDLAKEPDYEYDGKILCYGMIQFKWGKLMKDIIIKP
jgi:hypothetical protein